MDFGVDSNQMMSYLFPVLLILIFYFLMYRPQKKQQKKRKAMLEATKVGSRVVTVGGIYGEITAINGDRVRLKVANDVEIEVSYNAIGNNITQEKNDESNAAK